MFTGLVAEVGVIEAIAVVDGGVELDVRANWSDLTLGESIAVNGACLTVKQILPTGFSVHVVVTTLGRTRLGELVVGERVNLERALRVGDRLGGHLVQGHVDGLGTVVAIEQNDDARLIDLELPTELTELCIPLGSITVDGVSLTVNDLPAGNLVQLSIVPFTLEHTTLGELEPGCRVHIEGDLVGKHVRALAHSWRREEG